jgi:DnaK suppressor protein
VQHLTADALDRNENGSESKSPTHLAELGTETYEQEFTLRRVENEQEVLEEIEEAFERITDETFGICISCREAGRTTAIPKVRLREIPYARNCVVCERKREEHR